MVKKIMQDKKGEGYIDVIVMVFILVLILALVIKVYPVFVAKSKLDTFASELVRVAEIEGTINEKVQNRYEELAEELKMRPSIEWNTTGNVQIGDDISIKVFFTYKMGFFEFGNLPIDLESRASGKSEVYWK